MRCKFDSPHFAITAFFPANIKEGGFILVTVKSEIILKGLKNSCIDLKMSLKDKICIITGAGCGLGRAFCEQLLKSGAYVS